ncbi:MAG: hypothetical protein L3V56_12485 [Candidatus Magnetoovum sp. WYHC-5]|nr:hypothetical protein [Candidatus Magnetoovum sp. WYHC-5]
MNIKLYLNDPPGKKCSNIIAAASEMGRKYEFSLDVVKKTDLEVDVCCCSCSAVEQEFPAVEINGETVFSGSDVSVEEFEQEIIKRL